MALWIGGSGGKGGQGEGALRDGQLRGTGEGEEALETGVV